MRLSVASLPPSATGTRGPRTEFWRVLSWMVGDEHADVLCFFVDLYCLVFGVDPRKFWRLPPAR